MFEKEHVNRGNNWKRMVCEQELGLYYDGNNGTYYYYDKSKNAFEFHSQVSFPAVTASVEPKLEENNHESAKSKKRKNKKSKVSKRWKKKKKPR